MRSVRVIYKKMERMKYVSHLDMNRYIPRLIKVSKIPAWHTEGFNKHLYLTFALPLALGITSQYDMFDIKITDDNFTDEMILAALKKNAAKGIEIISCGPAILKATELSFAEFKIEIEDSDKELLDALQKMFNSRVILAEKKGKKGKVTELNLADKIKSIKTELENDKLSVEVVLPAGNTENINPMLFIEAFVSLGKRKPEILSIERGMLYTADVKEFA